MDDREKDHDRHDDPVNPTAETGEAKDKPSGQEVGPPGERVDDETTTDESKRTRRQE